jgi:cytosine/adenosine deaminase-related metal-dependent hydrolase
MSSLPPVSKLTAARLLARPGREPALRDVEIEIIDGRIGGIAEDDTRSAGDNLVLPALANGHDHGRGLLRLAYGALDDALEVWLAASSGLHPPIDPYLVAVNAFSRMARSGVTATVHCHMPQRFDRLTEEAKAVCQAARDIGIRIAFVVPMLDRNRLAYGEDESVLTLLDESDRTMLRERWVRPLPSAADQIAMADALAAEIESEQVNVQYGPFGLEWASDDLLGLVAERSAATGRRVHMHCQETRHQRAWADANYPEGFMRHMDELGVVSPRLTLAHCVWLQRAEWQLLAERGATVATNASSNMRLGSGIAPIADMLDDNVRVAFGVDALSLDDDDDALRELRLTYQLHGGNSFGPPDRQADLLGAAMTTAYEVIANDSDHGRIEPGAPADLIELDFDTLAADLISARTTEISLVLGRATRHHIKQVIAGGRQIVQNGRLLGVDEVALNSELLAQARAGADDANAFIPALERYQTAIRQFYNEGLHLQ